MPIGHWLAPMNNGHWPFCCINQYTCYTHGVKALHSYTAKQRYTVYSYYTAIIQLYIAIHYTTSTTPL